MRVVTLDELQKLCTFHDGGSSSVVLHPRTGHLASKYTAMLDRGYLTKERNVLEIFANGRPVIALPDTGVTGNVMTEEYARSLGVDIDHGPKQQYTFENAVGTPFQSIGYATLELVLPGDASRAWKCGFAIVERCAASIVLGKEFLQKAEVFTKLRHYLRKMALGVTRTLEGQFKKTWRLMLMESSRQKMRCFVDGQSTLAVADSGADVNLVSLAYAQMREWDITRLPLDEGFVILANGDTRKVFGYVDTDLKIQGKSKGERFYVLDGLESNVILGDDTIDEFKVFGLDDVFVDVSDFDVNEAFCLIQWVERYDEVEREVDELLSGHQGHSSSPAAHWAKRYWPISKRKASKPTPKDIKLALRSRLDYLDTMDLNNEDHAKKQQESLSGEALLTADNDNRKRREKHEQLRLKILSEIRKLEST